MRKVYWFVIALQVLSWVSATSRPFPPNAGLGVHQPGKSPESLQATLQESIHGGVGKMNAMANYREISKIGSSPPSCDHKCYGCTPCGAIQVPTTKMQTSHVRVQYANYEPVGWKCKCGPTYYTP
ncbi:EPIDERMAL PATTERNING FACTOR-like protein 1 [Pyrus ussuriensis x Pyrus communis]|uniref:Epidermal patterning factor-like protein n=1 Tax=Pyrus ussuriensis x Pyrus communis TaxID=2448454 RepID=A0A5N5GHJ4_9ROSA|nr:EPIDERMAL PATTERNING FACTOR-like protein 1 [Pyrus ussuriensis x Pyrus communis]